MMLWINLSTLLSIARESGTNKLYALVPQSMILPPRVHISSIELENQLRATKKGTL